MSLSKRVYQYLGLAALFGLLPMLAVAAPLTESQVQNKIDARLVDQVAINGRASFWVGMAWQADLSAAYDMSWEARGWYVYNTLVETAQQTQAGVVADLEAQGLEYESFWINNSIYVQGGDLATILSLAARQDVAHIKADDAYDLPKPPAEVEGIQGSYDSWGLEWVNAPDVWNMGYRGNGIVVAGIDTGVQYTHEQLYDTYRGTKDGTNRYNWCDPADVCPGDVPCDNNGHGTHTMGTLSGENDHPAANPNRIGMAPKSTWIACKGCEGQQCSDYALFECAEWVLAPTSALSGNCGRPGSGDPDKRPHIVNNSWGDTVSDPWYQSAVQAWQAAGIFPAFSAGNQNTCGSVGSPGDYPESFASTNHMESGAINPSYSSRGPSSFGMVPYCKPNIAAPGTGIWSALGNSIYDDEYRLMTGTSMASPHSAGAVALLWDACPDLIGQMDATFQMLQNTAGAPPSDSCAESPGCSDMWCNCTYGYGYLDIQAAVETCLGGVGMGYLNGYVYIKDTSLPIEGAGVGAVPSTAAGRSVRTTTDVGGYYTMTLLSDDYTATAAKTGYYSETVTGVEIVTDGMTAQDFYLKTPGHLEGYVYELGTSEPVEGASVTAVPAAPTGLGGQAVTDASGYYTMTLPSDTYTITASKEGYASETVTDVEVLPGAATAQSFYLEFWSRLDGHVYELMTLDPIEEVNVEAAPSSSTGEGVRATTDPVGYYTMTLLPGTYTVTAAKNGYSSETVTTVEIVAGEVATQDFYLEYLGGWIELPLPEPRPFDFNRFDGTFDPHDNLFYFLGGRTGSTSHDRSIWTYDPIHDSWADTGCDLNHNASNITVAYIEDDGTGRGEAFYVVGGYEIGLGDNIDVVQRFYPSETGCVVEDVTTDPFPGKVGEYVVGAGGLAVVDEKIYYFGGWQTNEPPYFSANTWEFDPRATAGSRWTKIRGAKLDPGRSYINTAVQDGLIYAMGGVYDYAPGDPEELVPIDTVEVFDPTKPDAGWGTLPSLPVATAQGRGFSVQTDTLTLDPPPGNLYVVGGSSQWPLPSVMVYEYNVVSDTWSSGFPKLNTARRNQAGAYASVCTPDQADGLPGMWVFGGRVSTADDEPPYGKPEYFSLACEAPDPPEAAFTAAPVGGNVVFTGPVTGCAPLAVQFTDVSSGTVLERRWDFGDQGGTSTSWRPMHTYDAAGAFRVTLSVSNTSGTDSIRGQVVVSATPSAAFAYSPTTIYTDTQVHFQDTSTGEIVERRWDMGDGSEYSVQNPIHSFGEAGTYTVTLTVTGDTGCPSTALQVLSVRDEFFYFYLPLVFSDY